MIRDFYPDFIPFPGLLAILAQEAESWEATPDPLFQEIVNLFWDGDE